MNTEEKKFLIVKSYISDKIGSKGVHLQNNCFDYYTKHLGNTGKVLGELLTKEIKEHNSKIEASQTRLQKLKYKDLNTYKSKLMKGHNIPFTKIDLIIKNHPDMDWYDAFLELKKYEI